MPMNSSFDDDYDDDFIAVTDADNNSVSSVDFLRRMVSMRPGGEDRIEQEHLVQAVEHAINEGSHLLVQAGTGTGKTIGLAIPAGLSGKRIIYSTATKQLSEQVVTKDLPSISETMQSYGGQKLNFALIKGRQNYVCLRSLDTINRLGQESGAQSSADATTQGGLFEEDELPEEKPSKSEAQMRGEEVTSIIEWEKKTRTGDRSEAPAVSDKVWNTVSVTNAECPGKNSCPFGERCYAERARDIARAAQVVVANHAVVGADIASDNSLLGDRDVLIVDEVHELDNYLSSAWGTELSAKKVHDNAVAMRRATPVSQTSIRDDIESLIAISEEFEKTLKIVDAGLIDVLDTDVFAHLGAVVDKSSRIDSALMRLSDDAEDKNTKGTYKSAASRARDLYDSATLLLSTSSEVVRWFARSEKEEDAPASMHAAPLRVGPRLMSEMHRQETTLIATSATITVGGKFDSMVHDLALNEDIEALDPINGILRKYPHRAFDAIDVGTPFDYANQGMLYIPDANDFPAPVGKDRFEHNEAVLEEALYLSQASKGRALILSTTASGAKRIGEHLREYLPYNVLIQGEAPPKQITEEFIADEHSVLCATMGMWHGLDVQGTSLSLVLIDKIPFKPFDDPLSLARQRHADSTGRNGFMDVYVAGANIMLAQGFGRLIRSKTDKGVVAILDPRLRTKNYGKTMLRSLPPMRVFSDREKVRNALQRLATSYEN